MPTFSTRMKSLRGVAQSVARLLWEQEVRGSSPRTPTGQPFSDFMHNYAGVTQLVEFLPSKQAVAGSSPVSRSYLFNYTS